MNYNFIFLAVLLQLPLAPYTAHQQILLGYKLDITRMSPTDWESLPRIGPKLAEKIVAYQKRFGPFRHPEDLQKVGGIGEKTYQLAAPYLETPVSKK